ncbi:MAG: CAP domain-containing protein [Ilumatobacteraceae bacterium]
MTAPLRRRPLLRTAGARTSISLALALAVTVTATPTVSADPGATIDGAFAGIGERAAGSVLELDVAGRGGTPSTVGAVALNLTLTGASGPGFATVYPCGSARPDASSINFGSGQTIANGLIASVGTGGRVCVYTSQRTHILADVSGSFGSGSDYRAQNPVRLLDTRGGATTIDGRSAGQGAVAAGQTVEVAVGGRGGVVADASAVALNLTITEAAGPGFATIYPCGSPRPDASTINFGGGETIANGVIATVGRGSTVCVYTSQAAHLVADVSGSFGGGYRGLNQVRLLDTRPDGGTVDGRHAGGGLSGAGAVVEFDVTDRGGTPGSVTAVTLNLTVTQTGGPGFATVYPCGSARPDASTVNFRAGHTVANTVIAPVGPDGTVCIYTSAPTHLVGDVSGVLGSGTGYRAQSPARILDTRRVPDPPNDAAQRSLALLNELRARHGVGPVVLDPAMSAAALAWSAEMSRSGFRHSTLGYAENIAWHSSALSPEQAAQQFHQMWVDSPGHFRNMIDPRVTRVGIGMYLAGSGWYGTHLFAG